MTDINKIFMKISANHGSKNAKFAIDKQKENNKKQLINFIEFIVMNLQAELERLSGFTLGQLKTQEIGSHIVLIIEEYLNKVIYLLEIEKEEGPYLEDFLYHLMEKYLEKINLSNNAEIITQKLSDLNLIHDFHIFVDNIKELELNEKNRILTYLTMLNIKRRIDRRLFLPSTKTKISNLFEGKFSKK